MAFPTRKVYGQSKQDTCYFCGANANIENSQGFIVCKDHKDKDVEPIRCLCGQWLDIRKSKWGAFFVCNNCGPVNINKAKEYSENKINTSNDSGFKLNKSLRDKEETRKNNVLADKRKNQKYQKDIIYTLDELDAMWE